VPFEVPPLPYQRALLIGQVHFAFFDIEKSWKLLLLQPPQPVACSPLLLPQIRIERRQNIFYKKNGEKIPYKYE